MKPTFIALLALCLCLPLAEAQDKPKALGPIAGSGTGFFITKDGYLLTNHHVVEGARDISIKTEKGALPAKIVKVDKNIGPNRFQEVLIEVQELAVSAARRDL